MTARPAFRRLGAAVLGACLLSSLPGVAPGQVAPGEVRLKAIYLRKILRFVQWPAGAYPANDAGFQFCVGGDDLLGFALTQEFRTFTIDERKVKVRWVQKAQDLKGCQALFISASEEKRLAKVLESVKGANVLTLGETDGFLEAGGMVQLRSQDSGFQFEVNLTAARNAGLRMDARLLGLAKRVVRGGEMPGG